MINIINNNINIVNILLGGIRKRVAVAKSATAAQVKGLKLPNGEYFLTIPEWDFDNISTTVNDDVLTFFDGDWIYTYNKDTEQYEDDEFYIKILSFDNTNLIYTIEADGDSGTIILISDEEPESEIGIKLSDGNYNFTFESGWYPQTQLFYVKNNGNILGVKGWEYTWDQTSKTYKDDDDNSSFTVKSSGSNNYTIQEVIILNGLEKIIWNKVYGIDPKDDLNIMNNIIHNGTAIVSSKLESESILDISIPKWDDSGNIIGDSTSRIRWIKPNKDTFLNHVKELTDNENFNPLPAVYTDELVSWLNHVIELTDNEIFNPLYLVGNSIPYLQLENFITWVSNNELLEIEDTLPYFITYNLNHFGYVALSSILYENSIVTKFNNYNNLKYCDDEFLVNNLYLGDFYKALNIQKTLMDTGYYDINPSIGVGREYLYYNRYGQGHALKFEFKRMRTIIGIYYSIEIPPSIITVPDITILPKFDSNGSIIGNSEYRLRKFKNNSTLINEYNKMIEEDNVIKLSENFIIDNNMKKFLEDFFEKNTFPFLSNSLILEKLYTVELFNYKFNINTKKFNLTKFSDMIGDSKNFIEFIDQYWPKTVTPEDFPQEFFFLYKPESKVTINLNKGWNLIGSSYDGTLEDSESIIIPNTLYAYDNSYVTSTEINANKGYWIKCNNEGKIYLNIDETTKSTDIQVNEGWNLIGSSIDGTLEDTESIIIPNTLYAYDNSYVTSTEINANKGYWIKCINSGTIKLE
jgi:hypothetical protein